VSVDVTPTCTSYLAARYPERRDRRRVHLLVQRHRVDHGCGVAYDTDQWYVTTTGGRTPLAWGDSAEELVAWVRSEGFRPEVL
jgi:hypothetical protein